MSSEEIYVKFLVHSRGSRYFHCLAVCISIMLLNQGAAHLTPERRHCPKLAIQLSSGSQWQENEG